LRVETLPIDPTELRAKMVVDLHAGLRAVPETLDDFSAQASLQARSYRFA
jgi:hypothetical protein